MSDSDKNNAKRIEERQKQEIIYQREKSLKDKLRSLEKENNELESELEIIKKKLRETMQENELLEQTSGVYINKSKELKQEIKELTEKYKKTRQELLELKQTNNILKEHHQKKDQHNINLSKKLYVTIGIAGIVTAVLFSSYSFFVIDSLGEEYRITYEKPINSNYVIQNLRGDTINTWLNWKIVDGQPLYVSILNSDQYDEEKISAVKDAIFSTEVIHIDASLLHKGPEGEKLPHYKGWKGALQNAAETDSLYNIPKNLVLADGEPAAGDIIIELTDSTNPDGFSGYTNSISDESQNQILKSRITIYDVDTLSKSELETIVRHEFGHALGLAHSTAPEDLMHPTIETEFPYISVCDVRAIHSLYDGSQTSEVICEI